MSSRNNQHSDPDTKEWVFKTGLRLTSSPTVVDDTVDQKEALLTK